jgi:predicted flap endonuclease-1-like 5' DNA nuclease
MNPVFMFVLGLLIGWLIEWVIDYYYWRRRSSEGDPVPARGSSAVRRAASGDEATSQPAARIISDDLKIIKGIGPVIERRLNEAGIQTFEQLGSLTVAQLRRILGDSIERLSDEESLLQQARDLARRK